VPGPELPAAHVELVSGRRVGRGRLEVAAENPEARGEAQREYREERHKRACRVCGRGEARARDKRREECASIDKFTLREGGREEKILFKDIHAVGAAPCDQRTGILDQDFLEDNDEGPRGLETQHKP